MIIRRSVTALVVGVLFGFGLTVAQMTNPEKVLAFLNLAGDWDPSLLLVMAAATTVAFFGFRWATHNEPIFETSHQLPSGGKIDGKLVVGAVIFGLGWGLAGYCPGPAITGLSSGALEPFVFVGAMIVGSQIEALIEQVKKLL